MLSNGVAEIVADYDDTQYMNVKEYGKTREFPRNFREVTLTTFIDEKYGIRKLAISFDLCGDDDEITLVFDADEFFKGLAKSIADADVLDNFGRCKTEQSKR